MIRGDRRVKGQEDSACNIPKHFTFHLSSIHTMEGTNNNDEVAGPHIDPVEGSDGGDLTTRQLDDGDEVTSMATPTLDERDGMSSSGT